MVRMFFIILYDFVGITHKTKNIICYVDANYKW